MSDAVTEVAFAPAPEAAKDARRFVEAGLRDHGCTEETVEIVTLLTSEVATNAVVHARTDFLVRLKLREERVRVEVDDEGMGAAVLTYAEPDDARGRGLSIVDALADRWGDEHRPGGRHRVWFELAMTRVAGGAGGS